MNVTDKDLNKPGAKDDQGKSDMRLITEGFPRALLAVGDIATFGAVKYSVHGWKTVPDGFNRYTSAMLRHLLAEATDEGGIDLDSGLDHATQVAWNAIARLELYLAEKETLTKPLQGDKHV